MNDTVATPSPGAAFSSPTFVPLLAIEPVWFGASVLEFDRSVPKQVDLPPPLTSPTLLSLHCALTN
jgi:hypothetical protein